MKNIKTILLSGAVLLTLSACGTTTTDQPDTTAPADTSADTSMVDTNADTSMDTSADTSMDTSADTSADTGEEAGGQVFTLDELSQYDGKDGNPAYVAVDGVVYDVTDSEAWQEGEHAGAVTAGNELSEEILESPHGESVLEDLPVVGTLEE